ATNGTCDQKLSRSLHLAWDQMAAATKTTTVSTSDTVEPMRSAVQGRRMAALTAASRSLALGWLGATGSAAGAARRSDRATREPRLRPVGATPSSWALTTVDTISNRTQSTKMTSANAIALW